MLKTTLNKLEIVGIKGSLSEITSCWKKLFNLIDCNNNKEIFYGICFIDVVTNEDTYIAGIDYNSGILIPNQLDAIEVDANQYVMETVYNYNNNDKISKKIHDICKWMSLNELNVSDKPCVEIYTAQTVELYVPYLLSGI